MKKVLLILLFVVMLSFSGLTALADTGNGNVDISENGEIFDLYTEFCKNYSNRTPESQGELNAANYLIDLLANMGYEGLNGNYRQEVRGSVGVYNDSGEVVQKVINSNNVVAYKRCGKQDAKLLVIGSPYSNSYSITESNGQTYDEGAYASSGAVVALLNIANNLKDVSLEFDVAIVFFTSEYYSFMGSKTFLEKNEQTLLGLIELSCIGGGDDLNVFYDEVETAHGKLFNSQIELNKLDIKQPPFDKNLIMVSNESGERPYTHVGYGANENYINKDIPSVAIFGYNWKEDSESTKVENILGTTDDRYDYVVDAYGKEKITKQISDTSTLVTQAVMQNHELLVAFEAYDGSYKNLYSKVAYIGVIVGLLFVALVLFGVGIDRTSKITKKAANPILNQGYQQTSAAQEEDIFGLGEQEEPEVNTNGTNETSSSANDTDDDIFGEF